MDFVHIYQILFKMPDNGAIKMKKKRYKGNVYSIDSNLFCTDRIFKWQYFNKINERD